MTSKRSVAYARVSTDIQAEEGHSLEAQMTRIKMNCESLGNKLVGKYIDEGISGKDINHRPEMLKLLHDAELGLFDEVVVFRLNRLSRSQLDMLRIVEDLERQNVSIRSLTETIDTGTPNGKLMLSILGGFAEYERKAIAENVKSGMKQRATNGYHNGKRLLGYRCKEVDDPRVKSILVIVPEEAEIVRLIFDMYKGGKGYKAIATYLNKQGYKTVRGNLYSIQGIRDILMNPTYAGYIRYNFIINASTTRQKGGEDDVVMTVGKHKPIISMETWEYVSEIFKKNKGRVAKIHKGVFLLTGILRCPECGAPMVAGRVVKKYKSGKVTKWKYYQCSKFKNYGSVACHSNSIRADYAEKYVMDVLKNFVYNEKVIEAVVSKVNEEISTSIAPKRRRLEQLEKEVKDYRMNRDRTLDLYYQNIIDENTLKERVKGFEGNIEENTILITSIKRQIDDDLVAHEIPIEQVKGILKSFGTLLKVANREQKKLLLNLAVEKIHTNDQKQIEQIELRFSEQFQNHCTDTKEVPSKEGPLIFVPFKLILDAKEVIKVTTENVSC